VRGSYESSQRNSGFVNRRRNSDNCRRGREKSREEIIPGTEIGWTPTSYSLTFLGPVDHRPGSTTRKPGFHLEVSALFQMI